MKVKCPQLFMPANGDAPATFPGGLGQQVIIVVFIVLFKKLYFRFWETSWR